MGYKVIDVKNKGNAIRVYLGDQDCIDYWGDDWDDVGVDDTVDPDFVKAYIDILMPFAATVAPCSYKLSKETLKQGRIPALMISLTDEWWRQSYESLLGSPNAEPIFFEMPDVAVLEMCNRLGVLATVTKVYNN